MIIYVHVRPCALRGMYRLEGKIMSREKELYKDTLERIRKKADELYPTKILYNQKEAASIMGCSAKKIQRRGLSKDITTEQLARIFS